MDSNESFNGSLMKQIGIYVLVILLLILSGILTGWFWHKSVVKPIIIQRPGETVYITEWKTNTVTKVDTIVKTIETIKWETQYVNVYPVVDTLISNTYVYADFFKQNNIKTKDKISFDVETKNDIKTYISNDYDKSYFSFGQSLRIKNFVYEPAPITIQPRQITSVMQIYGTTYLRATKDQYKNSNIIDPNYNFVPSIGISLVIRQRYKVDVGAQLNGMFAGVGIKFLDWK